MAMDFVLKKLNNVSAWNLRVVFRGCQWCPQGTVLVSEDAVIGTCDDAVIFRNS